MALLDVRGLTVELPTAAECVRPVNEVSLGLVGESGSGKTILVKNHSHSVANEEGLPDVQEALSSTTYFS